ncbi:MAG TPA: rhodanese-like domain-containing protein, partial [Terriglobales bacterium]|nr:rhodanese-like domain-containing protein [Terriglobales bacterium]
QTKLKPADIQQYSADLGLDQQKFAACLDDPATTARIRTDMADGQALDVRATPTFFLNGKKTEGALDMMQVAAALSAANAQPSVENKPAGTSPAPAQPGKQAKPASTVSAGSKLSYRDAPHNSGGPTVLVKGGDAKAPSTAPNPLIASGSGAFGAFSSGTGCSINPEPDPPMIHTSQARELFEKKSATFVDVRDADVSAKGRIPNSLNIPMDQLKRRLPELAKDKSFVLYEGGGSPGDPCALSKSAARIMIGSGFKQVHVFQEGLAGWRKDGLPVAQ